MTWKCRKLCWNCILFKYYLFTSSNNKTRFCKVCATYQIMLAWKPIFSLHCLYLFLQKFRIAMWEIEKSNVPTLLLSVCTAISSTQCKIKIIKALNITKGPLSFVNFICQFKGVRIELETAFFNLLNFFCSFILCSLICSKYNSFQSTMLYPP